MGFRTPKWLGKIAINGRRLLGCFDLNIRARALQLFKQQLERLHLSSDQCDSFPVNRIARLLVGAA